MNAKNIVALLIYISIYLFFVVKVVSAQSQNLSGDILVDKINCKENINLIYRVLRSDKAPKEFYELQINLIKSQNNQRLKLKEINSEEAAGMLQDAEKSFKHSDDVKSRAHLIFSGGSIWFSDVDNTAKSEAVITPHKSYQRDQSVTYTFDHPELGTIRDFIPLPLNLGVIKTIKYINKPKPSLQLLDIGSSVGAAHRTYWDVNIEWELKEKIPLVHQITQGYLSKPVHEILYQNHRRFGNIWLPGKITIKNYSLVPGHGMKMVLLNVTEYELEKVSSTIPPGIFDFMKHVKKDDMIQNDNGSTQQTFNYDNTKTLAAQHEAAGKLKRDNEEYTAREELKRRTSGSVLVTILGIGLLVYWFLRRRMKASRKAV